MGANGACYHATQRLSEVSRSVCVEGLEVLFVSWK